MAAARIGAVNRTEIAARILAATVANYVVTSLTTACLARFLWRQVGLDAANASVGAIVFSFLLFAVIALSCFAVRSASRLWFGLLSSGALLGGLLWLSLSAGGRL